MTSINIRDALERLEARRTLLEQGIRVALIVERLNRGLEAVLVSGAAGAYLPQRAVEFFDKLDPQFHALPNPALREKIQQLTLEVEARYKQILDLTRFVATARAPDNPPLGIVDVNGFLHRFTAQAEVLIGLRVLLHKRGEQTPGIKIHIPKQSIQQRLAMVRGQENLVRHKVRDAAVRLRDETQVLLEETSLSDSMREFLEHTLLDANVVLESLDAGVALIDLPPELRTIQVIGDPISSDDLCRELELDRAEPQPAPVSLPPPTTPDQAPPRPPLGFWATLKIWLNTPFRVSWSQIRDGK